MGAPLAKDRANYGSDFTTMRMAALSCQDADCSALREGWYLAFPHIAEMVPVWLKQATGIRDQYAQWTVGPDGEALGLDFVGLAPYDVDVEKIQATVRRERQLTANYHLFWYPPGQPCVQTHKIPVTLPRLDIGIGANRQQADSSGLRVVQPPEWLERLHTDTEQAREGVEREGLAEARKEAEQRARNEAREKGTI